MTTTDIRGAVGAYTQSRRRGSESAQRTFDLVLAWTALILLSPAMVAIAIIIKLDSEGPALFRQDRIGKNGRVFTMLKFRSMYRDNDPTWHKEAVRKTAMGIRTVLPDGRAVFKSTVDSRITRVGGFLRTWSLDELPQLWNVITGDMSLVGPRPVLDYELPYFRDWYFERFCFIPGITGLWQIRRSEEPELDDMMRLDIEYGRRATVLSDAIIVLKTIPTVIKDKGVF